MSRAKVRRRPAISQSLDRRLLLSGVTEGVYPLAPAAGLTAVADVSTATAAGTVYFSAKAADGTRQLWQTDGTPDGTAAVAPLPAAFSGADWTAEATFGDGRLLAADAGTATGFLVSDGTAVGTAYVPVAGLLAVAAVGARDGVYLDDRGANGAGTLWWTDGTAADTVQLSADPPLAMTADGAGLFFFTSTPSGLDLWHTDGTPAGTVDLATVNPDPDPGAPLAGQAAARDGELAFVVPAGPDGTLAQVWTSDGTPTGTRLVTSATPVHSVNPNLFYSPATQLFDLPGGLVFDGPDEFVTIDPTTGAETNPIASTAGGYGDEFAALAAGRTGSGTVAFYPTVSADFLTGQTVPAGWWTTDGSAAAAQPVEPATVAAGTPGVDVTYADPVPYAGGVVWAAADAGTDGYGNPLPASLLVVDPGAGTVHEVAPVTSDGGLANPSDLTAAAGGLVFVATPTAAAAPQLWAVSPSGFGAASVGPAPTAAVVPGSGGDGTFAVAFTDPVGMGPVATGAIAVTVAGPDDGIVPAFDISGPTPPTTPVDAVLVNTTASDGGRTVVATYSYPAAAGGVYAVSLTGQDVTDAAGRSAAAGAVGFVTPGPATTRDRNGPAVTLATSAHVVAGGRGTARVVATPVDVDSGIFRLRVYLSPADGRTATPSLDVAVASLTTPPRGFVLKRRGVRRLAVRFTVPTGTPAGTYRLSAVYDDGDAYLGGPLVTVKPPPTRR